MDGPNKLECNTALGQKGLHLTNNLDYLAHSKVTEKMKCCEYGTGVAFTTLPFLHNLKIGPMS
jgi:hypothetical protein